MEITNLAVLTQWLIFFATIATIFIPAFLFRKIALKRNKKGWLYSSQEWVLDSLSSAIAFGCILDDKA